MSEGEGERGGRGSEGEKVSEGERGGRGSEGEKVRERGRERGERE